MKIKINIRTRSALKKYGAICAALAAFSFFVHEACSDDFLIVNNTSQQERKWHEFWGRFKNWRTLNGNKKASNTLIQDYIKRYPGITVTQIDESGLPVVRYDGRQAAGSKGVGDRVVYVERPLTSREFLSYIDGSGVGLDTDRNDPNRRLKDTIYCGSHAEPEGGIPVPFVGETHYINENGVRVQARGAAAWEKTVTTWERGLEAGNRNTEDLFTPASSMHIPICYTAKGSFPQYMANVMRSDSKVYATESTVFAGGINVGLDIKKPDFYYFRGKTEEFQKGGPTNSEMAREKEMAYMDNMFKKMDAYRSQMSTDPSLSAKLNTRLAYDLAMVEGAMRNFEPTEGLGDFRYNIAEAVQKLNRGEFTPDDMKALMERKDSLFESATGKPPPQLPKPTELPTNITKPPSQPRPQEMIRPQEAPKPQPARPKWRSSSDTTFNQGQTAYAAYKNSKWRVELSSNGTLACYGADHGSWAADKKFIISYGAERFWTIGSWRGPIIVFQKKGTKKLYAVLLEYDSGRQVVSGEIMTESPAESVRLDGRTYGAYIYITLENGKEELWEIYQHPNLPGKIAKIREQAAPREKEPERFLYAMRTEAIRTQTGNRTAIAYYSSQIDVTIGYLKHTKIIKSNHALSEAEKFRYMYNYLSRDLGRQDLADLIREIYNKNGKI